MKLCVLFILPFLFILGACSHGPVEFNNFQESQILAPINPEQSLQLDEQFLLKSQMMGAQSSSKKPRIVLAP